MKNWDIKCYQRLSLTLLILLVLVPAVLVAVLRPQSPGRAETPRPSAEADAGVPVEAEPMGYQTLFPQLYAAAPIPKVRRLAENTVYLTFDGAPGENTQAVLDILAAQGVKATFFVEGSMDEAAQAQLRAMAAAGHTVGLASASGSYETIYQSVEAYLQDFSQLYGQVSPCLTDAPQLFRFPGGSINAYNSGIYQELIAEMLRRGFIFFDWNVSGADSRIPEAGSEEIRRSVSAGMAGKSRGVVKLNIGPGKQAVVEALPGVIQDLRAAGYDLQPLTAEVLPVVFDYTAAP